MEKTYKWLWLGLAVFSVVHFTLFFRYEPVPSQQSGGAILVWDRLTHKTCMGMVSPTAGQKWFACSVEELR